MNILIATDGQLDPEATTSMVARIANTDDNVTVLTVIDHPGEVLRSVAAVTNSDDVDRILGGVVGEMGVGTAQAVTDRLERQSRPQRGTAQPLDQYFKQTAARCQKGILAALAGQGIEANATWSSTENKTARTILDVAAKSDADITRDRQPRSRSVRRTPGLDHDETRPTEQGSSRPHQVAPSSNSDQVTASSSKCPFDKHPISRKTAHVGGSFSSWLSKPNEVKSGDSEFGSDAKTEE